MKNILYNMKINKKASNLLPDNAFGMILAVIGLVILFGLVWKLFGIFQGNNDFEKAQETLNLLDKKIKNLDETTSNSILLNNPLEWYLVYYEKNKKSPDKCEQKECLCICEDIGCEKNVCNKFEMKINLFQDSSNPLNYIKMSEMTLIYLSKKDKEINIFSDKNQHELLNKLNTYFSKKINFEFENEQKEMNFSEFIFFINSFQNSAPKELLDLLLLKTKEEFNSAIGNDKWSICYSKFKDVENCWIYINQVNWIRNEKFKTQINSYIENEGKRIYVKMSVFN